MYIDYGTVVEAERARRKAEGAPTLRWYKCHGCGAEYPFAEGIRSSTGCSNVACAQPSLHIHSDLDGEKPLALVI